MTLHTMFYQNEIRAAEAVPTDKVEVKDQEKKLAEQLIESLASPFQPEKYRDEYSDNVRAMIAAKLQGQEVAQTPQPHLSPVIDLMDALKKSIANKPAAKAPVAVPAAQPAAQAGPVPVAAGKKPPARSVEPAASTRKNKKAAS
jgi:DNA end-binding protein Ku